MTPQQQEAFRAMWRRAFYTQRAGAQRAGVMFYDGPLHETAPVLQDMLEESDPTLVAPFAYLVHQVLTVVMPVRGIPVGPLGNAVYLRNSEIRSIDFPFHTWAQFEKAVFRAIAGKKKRVVTPNPRRTITLERIPIDAGGYARDRQYHGSRWVYEAIDQETGRSERVIPSYDGRLVSADQRLLRSVAAVMLGIPNERLKHPEPKARYQQALSLAERFPIRRLSSSWDRDDGSA
jgi:hypothetical protein